MLGLVVKVDIDPAEFYLRTVGRQIPYAASLALNDAAQAFQREQRSWTGQIFRIRQPEWVRKSVKIAHFAKKSELWADIGIHPPGGDERADILGKFEDQTEKTPFQGTHIAVPIGPNQGKILRAGQRFRDFHFQPHGAGYRGTHGTFIIRLDGQRLLVLQRLEHGRRFKRQGKLVHVRPHDAVPLFLLVPRIQIRPDLHFYENAERVLPEAFQAHWPLRLEEALSTAIP